MHFTAQIQELQVFRLPHRAQIRATNKPSIKCPQRERERESVCGGEIECETAGQILQAGRINICQAENVMCVVN